MRNRCPRIAGPRLPRTVLPASVSVPFPSRCPPARTTPARPLRRTRLLLRSMPEAKTGGPLAGARSRNTPGPALLLIVLSATRTFMNPIDDLLEAQLRTIDVASAVPRPQGIEKFYLEEAIEKKAAEQPLLWEARGVAEARLWQMKAAASEHAAAVATSSVTAQHALVVDAWRVGWRRTTEPGARRPDNRMTRLPGTRGAS